MTPQEAQAVYVAAQKMSNWLYNMGQLSDYKTWGTQMRDMVREWDSVKSALAKLTVPRSGKKKAGSK